MDENKSDAIKDMTYEKAMLRLEEIASLLEKNEIPLEECMSLFEEGTRLASYCSGKLKEAQQKITLLAKDNQL